LHGGHALWLIAQAHGGNVAIGIESVVLDDLSCLKSVVVPGAEIPIALPLSSATVVISGRTINDSEGFTPMAASILIGKPRIGDRTVASAEVV
jgi:hypothetical protein